MLKRPWHWSKLTRFLSPAVLAVLLCAGIAGYLLFVPPINGYADNGDFYRAILNNGIYKLSTSSACFFKYVVPKYGIMQYYNENATALFSSQPLFVMLAKLLNQVFYSRQFFDIRFMALVYYIFYLGGIYLLVEALTYPAKRWRNYVIASLVVFVFADSSFTLYFNSFFAEPGMFVLMLYSFSSYLLLARKRFRVQWPMIVLYLVSTMLLIANKQQNAPLALSYAVVSIGLLFLPRIRLQRLYIIGGVVGILITGVLTYTLITKQFNDINQYQAFTHGVLLHNGDPSKKISKGGLDEQYALMRAQDYYPTTFAAITPSSDYVKRNLTSRFNFAWIVKYYAAHPQQFGKLMDVAAGDIMITQVKAVGNFTKASGRPAGTQLTYFTWYSQLVSAFFPQKFAFDCLLAGILVAVYAVGLYNDLRHGDFESVMQFFLVLGLMTIVVFVPIISVIGDGDADLAKHLFMIPLSLDLCFLMLIADILNHRLWHAYREGEVAA